MSRWVWWLPFGVFVMAGAILALRLGWIAANMTETDAISAYAARYVAQAGAGARVSDCAALPGTRHWLVLRCGRPGAYRGYWINRFGGLERETGPGPWAAQQPAAGAVPAARPET